MRKVLSVIAIVLLSAAVTQAQLTWIGDSYITVSIAGGSTNWYDGSANFQPEDFDGKTFNMTAGESFVLGGESQTYFGPNGTYNGAGATINSYIGYEINDASPTTVAIADIADEGNNDKWQNTTAVDLTSAFSTPGSYTLDVWFQADDNGATTVYDTNAGNNFVATVVVAVPEPTTMAFIGLGIGALVMALRRRRS